MLPKVAFVMLVWKSDYVLGPCLKALEPYGPVFVTEGPVRYWYEKYRRLSVSPDLLEQRLYTQFYETDRTEEILCQHVQSGHSLSGIWNEKDEMQNALISQYPEDTEYVWLVDSDEIWKPETIEAVLKLLEETKADSMAFKAQSFYGGFDHWITGFERSFPVQRIQRWYPGARWSSHRPPTVLAPDGRPWHEHKHISHEETDKLGLEYFHYSYVFPSQMLMKDLYYGEAQSKGLSLPDYFHRIYVPWVNGTEEQRRRLEWSWDGVHNWYPQARTPSFTAPFSDEHPAVIREVLPQLLERFEHERQIFCV